VNQIGFDHIGINTSNFEKSLVFYRDILGLEEMETVVTEELMSTVLAIPDGSSIELIKMHGESQQPEQHDVNLSHIAFNVDNVASFEEYLRKANVEIVVPCTELVEFNTRVVKCKDPNGIIIAFRKNIK
jgi:catechol 2,3-dioxygenase-like lactoylglutathione lyase family enzyme